ncbi:Ig-like domain-containing protein [Roseateles chitinivorans]|uniref:Ig-like domain-containing protein n=1 Tax=Roseateles chitinivorans TaxID=2917965 RepID=UPI003D6741E9
MALAFNALPDAARTDELRATLNKAFGANANANANANADVIAPVTTGITLSGMDAHGDDKSGKLTAGDKLRITLSMDESTLVVGSPTVGLDLGGHVVQAAYAATMADGRLVFEYVVQPVDYAAAGTVSVLGLKTDATDRLVDAGGNAVAVALPGAEQSHPVAVGNVLPVVSARLDAADDTGAKSDDGITRSSLVHVSVSGSAGNTVHLFEDLNGNGRLDAGEARGDAPVQAGASQATVAVALTEGRHELLAYQQDADGSTSAASAPLAVVVDTLAPAAAKLLLAGPDQVTRHGTPFSLVATPTFSIAAETGSRVTVFEDRNGDGVQDADEPTLASHVQTGSVDTVAGTAALGDGLHPLRVVTTDLAGNRSVSAIQDVGVASTPIVAPRIDLLPQEDTGVSNADGITSKSLLHLQVGGEPGNTLVVFDDLNGNGQQDDGELIGQAAAPAQPGVPLSLAASLAEGRHVLMAYQQDANGFTSELSTPEVVLVDKTAPVRATLGLGGTDPLTVNGMPVSLDATPTFEITAEKGARVVVFEDLNADGAQGADEPVLVDHTQLGSQDEVDSLIALGGGRHDLRVISTDLAGNRSVSDIQTIGILAKPIPTSQWSLASTDDTGDRADDMVTNRSTLHVQVTGDAGNTVHLFDDLNGNGRQDDGELLAQAQVQDGEVQASLVFNLAEGRHVLRAYQQDATGLSGSVSAPGTIVVDRTGPTVGKPDLGGPDSTTLNGQPVSTTATPLFELTAEKGSHVSVFEDQNGNGQIDDGEKVLVAGHLQIGDRDEVASAMALADGSYDLRVVATDVAGNRSVSAIQTLSVAATAVAPPTLGVAAADDTGRSNSDLVTSKKTVSILVDGTPGTTVKVFNDFNQNGKEDTGESVGAVTLTAPDTHGSVDAHLVEGVNHLRAYAVDVLGRKSATGDDLAVTLDQQAPQAPTVQLAASSDTGVVGDKVTALESLTLQIAGEAGAQFIVFDDRNGNQIMDAGEQIASGALAGTPANAQVSLAEGMHTLRVIAQDTAGNASAATPFTLTVNHSLPTLAPAKAIELDGRTLANTDVNDSLLPNLSPKGDQLSAAHLGLTDPTPRDVNITFGNTVNVTIAIDGTLQHGSTVVTLQQVIDGHVSIVYGQDNPSLLSGGVFADVDFTVTKPSATTESMSGSLNFSIHNGTGIAVFGDGSGSGSAGAVLNLQVTTGNAGAGGTDQLLGTTHADLIFGDGSGGGAGRGMSATGVGGAAGGGMDSIAASDGDDIIFGDGFSGSADSQGGYGGGGGGGGNGAGSAGVIGGIGGGTGGTQATGGSTTLGAVQAGGATDWGSSRTSGGGGAGVGAGTGYTAEFDGAPNTTLHQYDNTGSAASAVAAARNAFLDGPGAGNGENRMFTQAMGVGNDTIDGGDGNDYIMAGNGNDTIVGGRGNDVMYGRGGSTNAGTDNDTFVWRRGDAGTTGALDVIRDFGTASGNQDKLSLLTMLEGRKGPTDDLSQWIHVYNNAQAPQGLGGSDAGTTGALIRIDIDGAGPGQVVQQIYLTGVTLASTDLHTLISNGTIL